MYSTGQVQRLSLKWVRKVSIGSTTFRITGVLSAAAASGEDLGMVADTITVSFKLIWYGGKSKYHMLLMF